MGIVITDLKMLYPCLSIQPSVLKCLEDVVKMQTVFVLSGLESHCTQYYRVLDSMAELKA